MREKIKCIISVPTADGTRYQQKEIVKNAWRCNDCGLVWKMKHEAEWCKHEEFYDKSYGGMIMNGTLVGNRVYRVFALRREEST
jgi:hypothetical protein